MNHQYFWDMADQHIQNRLKASTHARRIARPVLKWAADLACGLVIPAMPIVGIWFWFSVVALVRGL
jgi:hypothetical protein